MSCHSAAPNPPAPFHLIQNNVQRSYNSLQGCRWWGPVSSLTSSPTSHPIVHCTPGVLASLMFLRCSKYFPFSGPLSSLVLLSANFSLRMSLSLLPHFLPVCSYNLSVRSTSATPFRLATYPPIALVVPHLCVSFLQSACGHLTYYIS